MFVEPFLWVRPRPALGDSEGSDLAPGQGTQDPQRRQHRKGNFRRQEEVGTSKLLWGLREWALSSFRELKEGCLEEVALGGVLEGEQDISSR